MNKILAQNLNIDGFTLEGPSGFAFGSSNIGQIVGSLLGYIFAAAGVGLLLMIISSGFTLMTSGGDAKKMSAGKSRLTNAITGFLLVFAAFWIVQIMGTMLGWQSIFDIFGQ